jgi:hypothetical protein
LVSKAMYLVTSLVSQLKSVVSTAVGREDRTRDMKLSHGWLQEGRLQAKTVVAAQDGVIYTRAFRCRVSKVQDFHHFVVYAEGGMRRWDISVNP